MSHFYTFYSIFQLESGFLENDQLCLVCILASVTAALSVTAIWSVCSSHSHLCRVMTFRLGYFRNFWAVNNKQVWMWKRRARKGKSVRSLTGRLQTSPSAVSSCFTAVDAAWQSHIHCICTVRPPPPHQQILDIWQADVGHKPVSHMVSLPNIKIILTEVTSHSFQSISSFEVICVNVDIDRYRFDTFCKTHVEVSANATNNSQGFICPSLITSHLCMLTLIKINNTF